MTLTTPVASTTYTEVASPVIQPAPGSLTTVACGCGVVTGTWASWFFPDAQIAPPTSSIESGVKWSPLTGTGAPPCSEILSTPPMTGCQIVPPLSTARADVGWCGYRIEGPTAGDPPGETLRIRPPFGALPLTHRAPSPDPRLKVPLPTTIGVAEGSSRSTTDVGLAWLSAQAWPSKGATLCRTPAWNCAGWATSLGAVVLWVVVWWVVVPVCADPPELPEPGPEEHSGGDRRDHDDGADDDQTAAPAASGRRPLERLRRRRRGGRRREGLLGGHGRDRLAGQCGRRLHGRRRAVEAAERLRARP